MFRQLINGPPSGVLRLRVRWRMVLELEAALDDILGRPS